MQVAHNLPLSQFTSLKIGGSADRVVTLESEDRLKDVVQEFRRNGPVWVMGYGTNCLVSDKGLPGTVILNRSGRLDKLAGKRFKADSGVSWDQFVSAVIDEGLWGIEFASGIPGGVGAAITGNVAAYGHKVADVFVDATILDPRDGSLKTWRDSELGFDYRSSALQLPENRNLIVIDATFELSNKPTGELEYQTALKTAEQLGLESDSLQNRRKIIMETRLRAGSLLSDSQGGPWTAGSFFKNPVVNEDQIQTVVEHDEAGINPEQLVRQSQIHTGSGARVSAAHVLLAAGFSRGQSWGNVRLHPDHILKIENTGKGTAREIYDVVQQILATVKEKLNIDLEPEVRFLGEF